MSSFCAVCFPLDVLDEIWDVIELVSEGFLTYSFKMNLRRCRKWQLDSLLAITYETESMTGIPLKWESLKKRRKDSRLILLYKGLKGTANIPTDDLVPPNRRTRNHHSLVY